MQCPTCGNEFLNLGNHTRHCKGGGGVAVAERPMEAEGPVPGQPRSERGKRRYAGGTAILTPLAQIRVQPQGVTGAWAYYLRPDGATIRDALILNPNGGVPDLDDRRLQGKYGTNAAYFREKAQRKGRVFLGQQLDERAMRLLVETLAKNRGDEILFCEDEIATCEFNRVNNESQREREIATKRKTQFQRRLDTLRQPFDPDALLAELNDIARAQMLASVDPKVMRVMRAMIGEVNSKLEGMVGHFQSGKQNEQDPSMTGMPTPTRQRNASDAVGSFGDGQAFIDG